MRCRVCRGPAIIDVRRHNANFCEEHFIAHCHHQVQRVIEQFKMFGQHDKVLVAVSGGKDSLALWDILVELGYSVDGLYLGLGIGDYSSESRRSARAFAERVTGRLIEIDLPADEGFDVASGAAAARRAPCSACGLSKRHLFNREALEGGYDVICTGHNLDDEAAVLLGNVLHWNTEYLGRQHPVLEARPGFVRKVKPLVRLGEREMAAYCIMRRIDYQVDECPMSKGNRHLVYKAALDQIEAESPGTKSAFFHEFLDKSSHLYSEQVEVARDGLTECSSCGSPTTSEVCAYCRMLQRIAGQKESTRASGAVAPVRIEMGDSRR